MSGQILDHFEPIWSHLVEVILGLEQAKEAADSDLPHNPKTDNHFSVGHW